MEQTVQYKAVYFQLFIVLGNNNDLQNEHLFMFLNKISVIFYVFYLFMEPFPSLLTAHF